MKPLHLTIDLKMKPSGIKRMRINRYETWFFLSIEVNDNFSF